MNLIYKQPDASVNVSKVSPLKKFLQLLLGFLLVTVVAYVLLGFLIEILAPHIPMTVEMTIGDAILSEWVVVEHPIVLEEYEDILIKLIGETEANKYHIKFLEDDTLNAFAMPGNIIGFTTGFVDQVKDEEMIAFTLGHELGHFKNRDHIKSYGRLVVVYSIIKMTTDENILTDVTLEVLSKVETKFSQKEELAADAYGATLLENAYGSVEGGIKFFEELDELSEESLLESYFSTHPHPQKRMKILEDRP